MNKEIKVLVREIKSIELINSQLTELKEIRDQSTISLTDLESSISSKLNEITSLENNSFLLLFSKLIRNNKNILEISKEHYLKMCLEYNEKLQELEIIAYEIEVLTVKQKNAKKLKTQLRHLIKDEFKLNSEKRSLVLHKQLISKIESHIRLEKEIEEAIKEGVILNKRFNEAIKYLKDYAEKIYNENNRNMDLVSKHNVKNLEKFQLKIIRIKHSMLRFRSEIKDVYTELRIHDYNGKYDVATFIHEYRRKLARDIKSNRGLNRSFEHLKEQKSLVLEFTHTLRRDLRRIKKQLIKFESEESIIIDQLK